METDVLIITVTKAESRVVLEAFREATGQAPRLTPIGEQDYRALRGCRYGVA